MTKLTKLFLTTLVVKNIVAYKSVIGQKNEIPNCVFGVLGLSPGLVTLEYKNCAFDLAQVASAIALVPFTSD